MEDVKDRIKILIEQKKLSYGEFAEKLGIDKKNSSIISHIINERNKPSLEIVQKTLFAFPEVNSDWLIFGKEPMLRQKTQPRPTSLFDFENENSNMEPVLDESNTQKNVSENLSNEKLTEKTTPEVEIIQVTAPPPENKTLKKIIVLFSDATYEER